MFDVLGEFYHNRGPNRRYEYVGCNFFSTGVRGSTETLLQPLPIRKGGVPTHGASVRFSSGVDTLGRQNRKPERSNMKQRAVVSQ